MGQGQGGVYAGGGHRLAKAGLLLKRLLGERVSVLVVGIEDIMLGKAV